MTDRRARTAAAVPTAMAAFVPTATPTTVRTAMLTVLLAVAVITGCGACDRAAVRSGSTTSTPAAPVPVPTPSIPPGRRPPSPGPSAATFTNPVFAGNFPDPAILRVGALYYAYSTNSAAAHVPVMSSPDLVTWTPRGDALPTLPAWAGEDDTWAPEVIGVGAGYVLFYTAPSVATGTQCIGRARSDSPLGPFVDVADDAIVCQNEKGGSIDPSPVRALDGSLYLLWKNDGNCCGYDVDLWSQRLSADGLDTTGSPHIVLGLDRGWQGELIEGPEMIAHGGRYWLFYAANDYASAHYAEGVASCRSPLGPCTDSAAPILTSTARARGPGHGFVVTTPAGHTWMAFHAWAPGHIGGDQPGRQLWLTRLTWTAAGPSVARPSTARQRAPR